jgi:hypothetical protein
MTCKKLQVRPQAVSSYGNVGRSRTPCRLIDDEMNTLTMATKSAPLTLLQTQYMEHGKSL